MSVKQQNQKKRRSENWTLEERDFLLEIIKKYRHVLDNQNNNASTNKLKKLVWNHITNRFQQISNSNRDVKQLKSFWKRLKIAARKKARLQINAKTIDDNVASFCYDSNSHNKSTSNPDNKLDRVGKGESAFSEALKITLSENESEVSLLVNDDKNNLLPNSNEDENVCENGNKSYFCNSAKTEIETESDSNDELVTSSILLNKNLKRKLKNGNYCSQSAQGSNSKLLNYKTSLLHKEFLLKKHFIKLYHKKELKHQNQKHLLEIENLLLQRKRFEIELELLKKKVACK